MTVPVTKSIKVTFKTGMPLGVRGSFKRDGEEWIAIPLKRYERIVTMIDRLVNIYASVQRDTLRIINDHPEDARRCATILDHVSRTRVIHRGLVRAKGEINAR